MINSVALYLYSNGKLTEGDTTRKTMKKQRLERTTVLTRQRTLCVLEESDFKQLNPNAKSFYPETMSADPKYSVLEKEAAEALLKLKFNRN